MALDSKQKRGSAINCGIPFRRWLAEPDGTLADTDRASLMKWCSAVVPDTPVADLVGALCGKVFVGPSLTGDATSTGRLTGSVTISARLKGIIRNACT